MNAAPTTLGVSSPAFPQGGRIPEQFTCKGNDVSPALALAHAPPGTKSFALILDDPDAPGGTWTHWTAWNLPASTTHLPEDVDVQTLRGVEGTTSAGSIGYHGPCPPNGTHRYFVRVYALSAKLELKEGAMVDQLRTAMAGKILASGELMGTFAKA